MQAASATITRGSSVRLPSRTERAPSSGRLMGTLALGSFPALVLAIIVAKGGGITNPWVIPLGLITLLANVMIISSDIRYGLAMFIVAAGLSPKLPGIYDNLRVEDFIFAMVFCMWLSQRAKGGKRVQLHSPIIQPFIVLTAMSIFSTIWGFALGQVPDIKYSFFLQAKRVEYFLIFYVIATTIKSEGWLKILLSLFVASGALAAIYGLLNQQAAHDQTVSEMRVMGPEGENYNTLSGYLVVCIAAGIAAIPVFPKGRTKLFIILCTAIAATALLLSFSREGYIMLVGSLLVFGMTRYRGIVFGVFVALIIVFFVAEPVRQNVHNTVGQIQNARDDDPGSNSLTARFRAWEYRWNGWFMKQPLLGNGVGSVALSVDNEYVLRLCEVGVVGFGIFLWWLTSIGQQVKKLQKTRGLAHMISIGLLAAFVGLVIQGMAAASFNSIRTMEPFWFLLGLVTAAAMIQRQKAAQEALLCAS